MSRFFPWALIGAALLPSLWFAWYALGTPHLGYFEDDSLYLTSALSLAEGGGYRLASLPGAPVQTRFPPLFAAYLAPFAHHRAYLPAALWMLWPCAMSLYFFWLRQQGWADQRAGLLCLLLGANAYTVLFSGSVVPEMMALALLFAAFYLIEHQSTGATILAGIASAGAYLTENSLLAAGAGLLVYLLYRRRWREAAVFTGTLGPAVAWWQSYIVSHMDHTANGMTGWYTDGFGFYRENVSLDLLPALVWHNLQALLASGGRLLYLHDGSSSFEYWIAGLVLVAAALGIIRGRRVSGYLCFVLLYCAGLLVWNYEPTERYLMPVLPLLLAGLLREGEHFYQRLREWWPGRRTAVVVLGGAAVAAAAAAVWHQAGAVKVQAKGLVDQYRQSQPARAEAYRWVADNTSTTGRFLSADHGGLFLATGRQGLGLHYPTRYLYWGQRQAIVDYLSSAPELGRAADVDYLFVTPFDFERELSPAERSEVRRRVDSNPYFYTVYERDGFLVKKRTPPWSPALFPLSKLQSESASKIRSHRRRGDAHRPQRGRAEKNRQPRSRRQPTAR